MEMQQEPVIWYSFNDGNWNDYNTWSTNADTPINDLEETPGANDRVIIRHTVSVTDNNTTADILEVNYGILDFGTTTGNSFTTITGQSGGTIRLAAGNFPSGEATGFANAATGGTVEYYGTNYNLSSPRNFRNVRINLDAAGNQITLLADYHLSGSLEIQRGELHFGNNSSTASLNITVLQHLEVKTDGKIRTGTADARHQLNLYGDFNNQGDVQFTNRTSATYNSEATNGITDVNFLSTVRSQYSLLEGPSRFYRISINKATATHELHLEATDASYFNLFGFANQGHGETAQLTSNSNSLGLISGTVRIGDNITVPQLNGGNNYNISENAILWVDGGSVTKPGGTAVVIYGKVKVSAGTFTANIDSGITTRLNGIFESTGGTTVLGQFRTSVLGTDHVGGYIQTGGTVIIKGTTSSTGYYSFTLSYPGNSFTLTGGTLHIEGTNSKGGIFIKSDPVNQNVGPGATLILQAVNTTPFRITSTAPLPTVEMSRSGTGSRSFVLEGAIVGTTPANQSELFQMPLRTVGSLTINSDIDFDPKGQDVTIGGSYSIGSGASYVAGSNTTIFSGATTNYIISINATATKYFHNLSINNPGTTGTFQISDVTIGNNLSITAGTLALEDRILTVRGDISNSGIITNTSGKVLISERGRVHTINITDGGSYTSVPNVTVAGAATAVAVFNGTPSAGNPLPINKIVITNTGSGYTTAPAVSFDPISAAATAQIATTHELSGNGTGIFGNLEINEPHPAPVSTEVTYLTANQTVTGTMTLTNGVFDLKTHNLDLEGTLSSNSVGDYSTTKMFRTDGNHGDGGLTRTISADGTYLFPLGTINNDNNAYRYAWANPTFSNVSGPGKVQINGVPRKLATLSDEGNPNDRRYLRYYWRINHSGFAVLPSVHNRFIGYSNDLYSAQGQANWNNFIVGKVINNVRYPADGDPLGSVDNYDGNSRLLNYTTVLNLEAGEFTAGRIQMFSGEIRVFYSYTTAASWDSDWWDEPTNWSYQPHTFEAIDTRTAVGDNQFPGLGDIAIIGYGGHSDEGGYHSVNIRTGVEVGLIKFVPHPNPPANARLSRVTVRGDGQSGTLDAGVVEGPGEFSVRFNHNTFPQISADFSDFVLNDTAVFHFQPMSENQLHTIHNISNNIFPNLRVEGAAGRTATIEEDFLVRRNFTIDGGGEFVLHSGEGGDMTVIGDLQLGDWNGGTLSFSTSGHERTAEVGGIRFQYKDNNADALRSIRVLNSNPEDLVHRLIINGNIYKDETTNNEMILFTNNTGGNNVILEMRGEGDHSFTVEGGIPADFNFYRIIMNKGTSAASTFTLNSAFTLGGSADGSSAEKPLQLQNGKLILNDPGINLNLTSGGESFFIPSTAGLVIREGTVNVIGNTGISLDGLLRAEGTGVIDMEGGNNFIEYSASGRANLEVAGDAQLIVGSQIRRSTSNPSGVLRYAQSGGTVEVGKSIVPVNTRGVFEITNVGSRFEHTGGSLTIIRPQSSASTSIVLEPSTSSVGNTTLQIGNADTPASSTFTLRSAIELGNLTIGGSSTAKLENRSLIVKADLTIGSGSSFDGDGSYNLTVNRHLNNMGEPDLNVDTLFFRGSATSPSEDQQEITGSLTVKNLVIEPETSVTIQPSTFVEVTGNLYINNGQFIDGGNIITLRGNITNNSAHISSTGTGGLLFNGSSLQRIYGNGQFGRIEVDNPSKVQLESSIQLNHDLDLINGIFHLQQHRLTLGVNANVTGGTFGPTRMVAVSGAGFAPLGLRKTIPVIFGSPPADPYDPDSYNASNHFLFPVGTDDGLVQKYIPMHLYIASNATQGTISVVPVDQSHITFDDVQAEHILHQYWAIRSEGIFNFTALHHNHYTEDAVNGNEAEYVGARLNEGFWTKLAVINEIDNYIAFIHTGVDQINGDYTAGEPDYIQDEVPIYYSRQDGSWMDQDTWERSDGLAVPAGGPVGQRVHIRTSHTVTIPNNFRRAYETRINGRLELGSTINHILGYVSGTGTLATTSSAVPTGNYEIFFGCGGGTMEYGGAGYNLPGHRNYNNLTITGSGEKTFPNQGTAFTYTICNDLRIENTSNLKIVTSSLNVMGDIYKDNDAGFNTAGNWLRLVGDKNQLISGEFIGTNKFWSLLIEKNSGNATFDNNLVIHGNLRLYGGILSIRDNTLNHLGHTVGPAEGRVNSFIDGKFSRNMAAGSSFIFPVGYQTTWKPTTLSNVSLTGFWGVNYFRESIATVPISITSYGDGLELISNSEYWIIESPGVGTANISLRLNGSSDIAAALGEGNLDKIRIVIWDGTNWEIVGGVLSLGGSLNSGTLTSSVPISFDGADQYITLGSIEEITTSTAQIVSGDADFCGPATYDLLISLTGTGPWEVEYTDGNSNYSETITTSALPIALSLGPGAYNYSLVTVTDGNDEPGAIIESSAFVRVFSIPESVEVTSSGDICGPTTTTISTLSSEQNVNYQLYLDGDYYGITLVGNGGPLQFTGVDQAGVYSIRAFNVDYAECYNFVGGISVERGAVATVEITGLINSTPICEGNQIEVQITFSGTPPFTFTVEDNYAGTWTDNIANLGDLSGFGPYTLNFTIPDPPIWISPDLPTVYTYSITFIEDASGCGEGFVQGAGQNVDVYKIPETGPQYHIPNTFGN
jgi:hypothetical protein